MKQLNFRVDEDIKAQIDALPQSNKEFLTNAALDALHGRGEAILRAKLERLDTRIDLNREEQAELEREEQELLAERARLEAQLEAQADSAAAYREFLDALLDGYEEGRVAVVPDTVRTHDQFSDVDVDADQVVEDARERAIAQGRDMTERAFTPPAKLTSGETPKHLSEYAGFGEAVETDSGEVGEHLVDLAPNATAAAPSAVADGGEEVAPEPDSDADGEGGDA